MWRRDRLVFGAALLTLAGMASGRGWVVLVAAAGGWLLLVESVRRSAPALHRRVLLAGAVAGLVAVLADLTLAAPESAFLFHIRREVPWLRVSPGVEAARGVLLTGCLYLYVRLRSSVSVVFATLGAAALALAYGFLFESVGSRFGLWAWNAAHMPNWRFGGVWMFVPVAWGVAFLLPAYYLMGFHRRVPSQFYPVGVGIRCGTAYVAFLMIAYGLCLRLFGKAELP